jgi:branched-chain amino acid transport system substrate-binding protein
MERLSMLGSAVFAAAVVSAVVALGACSPSEDSGGGSEGTLDVGLLMPTTGPVAAAGTDMLHGWQLWFKQHGDEIAGRKIVSTHEDTAGDPTTALTKARRLVQQKNAEILVGPLLANEGYALTGLLEENEDTVVGLNPVSSSDDLSQRKRVKNFIRTGGWQSSSPAHVAGDWAAQNGWKRVATLCADYAFGYENCGGFTNTFSDRGGEVVNQLYAPLGTTDYSSYLAQIDPNSVDGVFATVVGADSPRFIKAWNDLGLKGKVPLIANETTFEQSTLRGISGDSPVGLESFGHYAEGRTAPGTRDFVDAYEKEYGEKPGYYSCATYTAAQWLTKALEELDGDISDTDEFIATLNSVKLDDSCFGPMRLDKYGGTVQDMYLRKVVRASDGGLVNEVTKTYPDISQFWNYDPEAFLKQPVYSREDQGEDWPTSCEDFAKDCPLNSGDS